MALSNDGSGLAFTDAGNGKLTFKWANGNPVFDDAQTELVMSLLIEFPGWFGDHLKKRRSKLSQITTNDASTAGRIVEYAKDALQPGLDDGRLKSVNPTVAPNGSGYLLHVSWVTGADREGAVTMPLSV